MTLWDGIGPLLTRADAGMLVPLVEDALVETGAAILRVEGWRLSGEGPWVDEALYTLARRAHRYARLLEVLR